jgi:hypothetical protein
MLKLFRDRSLRHRQPKSRLTDTLCMVNQAVLFSLCNAMFFSIGVICMQSLDGEHGSAFVFAENICRTVFCLVLKTSKGSSVRLFF